MKKAQSKENFGSAEVMCIHFIKNIYESRFGIKVSDEVMDEVVEALEKIPEVYNADWSNYN